jgi:hypothetical protein
MVMVGELDFRSYAEVAVPRGSLVLHGCPACCLCADEETWSVHWLVEGESLEIHGDATAQVLLGTRWYVTEYPTPEFEEFPPETGSLAAEGTIYFNFVCGTDKVGGHLFWIQGATEEMDPGLVYIGQMTGEDASLIKWDSPIVYLFYAPETQRTIAWLQSF